MDIPAVRPAIANRGRAKGSELGYIFNLIPKGFLERVTSHLKERAALYSLSNSAYDKDVYISLQLILLK